jgi:hypothetical protein
MANLQALKKMVFGLSEASAFSTGIVGATSQRQHQILELRKSFARLQSNPAKDTKADFYQNLLAAHAVSLITDNELQQCESWLEEN